eukprot:SRR837773.14405.p1 GENE.SRR837773.14405~~SRR837773.14405.p1  ORF type:complete len:162 (+),score=14.03 SRR837773.14405:44-529(+)
MLAHGAAAADVAALPAAGSYRGRHLPPRELLLRSGSHAVSPPHHPKVDTVFLNHVADPNPGQHSMHLLRASSAGRQEHFERHSQELVNSRPAGVASAFQTGKTRGIFKHQSVVGQFANDAVSAIPDGRKALHSIRETGMSFVPHQQHTTFVRKELVRSGHL